MRASDADRDAVLAELGEHFQAGRLTSDELAERTGLALQARTFGDLEPLTADLPAVRSADPMTGPAAGAIKPGRAWRPALAPIVLGLVVLMVVVGALMGAGTGARGSHLWWLILVVPLVARRVASRGRR